MRQKSLVLLGPWEEMCEAFMVRVIETDEWRIIPEPAAQLPERFHQWWDSWAARTLSGCGRLQLRKRQKGQDNIFQRINASLLFS